MFSAMLRLECFSVLINLRIFSGFCWCVCKHIHTCVCIYLCTYVSLYVSDCTKCNRFYIHVSVLLHSILFSMRNYFKSYDMLSPAEH